MDSSLSLVLTCMPEVSWSLAPTGMHAALSLQWEELISVHERSLITARE